MSPPTENGGPIPGLQLDLPPEPRFVRTARHAAGALARLHEIPEDLIEDIKLAVSEACTTAVAAGRAAEGSPVRLRAWVDGDRVVIEVFDPAGSAPREVAGSPEDIASADMPFESDLAMPLIRGLVDDLAIAPAEGGGITIRMVVSVSSQGS